MARRSQAVDNCADMHVAEIRIAVHVRADDYRPSHNTARRGNFDSLEAAVRQRVTRVQSRAVADGGIQPL